MALLAPVAKGGTLPVLSAVLIEAAPKGGVILTASNLDQTLRVKCAADVAEAGDLCVSAALLNKLAGEMDGDTVALTVGADKALALACGSFAGRVLGMAADEFPPIPRVKGTSFAVTADPFTLAAFASEDETRHILNGVHLEAAESRPLVAVATDGKRLAAMQFDAPGAAVNVTVPTDACKLFAKLAAGGATLTTDGKMAVLTAGGLQATTKLIEGTFPNWRQVVPTGHKGAVVFETPHLFAEAVRRVALLTDEKSAAVRLGIAAGKVTVSAAAADVGSAQETVAAQVDGPAVTVACNPAYLLAAIGRPAQYALRYEDVLSPVVVEGGAFMSVIMPMRVA
jgi:DNA polymerase-3 subunit beta